jgi:drug/metabolite transporter (DMT)-like permease
MIQLNAGYVYAMLGAIAFSGKGILIKLSYLYKVDAMTLIMYRMLFALPFFLAMAFYAERRARKKGHFLTRRDALGVMALGFIGYYFSSYLDFLGLQYVSVSLERLILYLNPTMVLLLGWILYKRQVTKRRILAMAVSYSGVLLVFGFEMSSAGPDVLKGSVLVFLSALTYACYLVFSEHLLKKMDSLRLVGWASSVACVCCIAQFLILRPIEMMQVDPAVLSYSVMNALLCTVAPILFVMRAIERLGPSLASQIGMIGPMSTMLMGYWFLNEPIHAMIGLGTLLVMGGVFMVSKLGVK